MRHLPFAALSLLFIATMSWAQSNPQPLVYPSLVPVSTAPGGPAFSLTVGGIGFVAGSVVQWNGSPRTTTFISNSSLQSAITAADIAKAGTVLITVLNPAPGGGTSNMVNFQITNPEATISVASDSAITTPYGGPGIVVGDFVGEGVFDVLAGTYGSKGAVLAFYGGNGDGTFKAPILSPAALAAASFIVGDFNNDGKPDVIGIGYEGDYQAAELFLNNGDGTFSQGQSPNGGIPIAAGDFFGDGSLDLIESVCSVGVCNLLFLKGDGNGHFGNSHYIDPDANIYGNAAVGDFNGDGKLDFVMSTGLVFLGNGDGTFQPPITIPNMDGDYIAAADLNGDGKLDLVVNAQSTGLCVFLGNGDGTFVQNCYGDAQFTGGFNLGDFNGDGKLDLAASTYAFSFNGLQVYVLLGNGDGTFQPAFATDAFTGFVLGNTVGDFNGDGRLDFASPSDSGVSLFLQSSASVAPFGISFGSHQLGVTSQPQNVTVTNNGSTTLKISNVSVSGAQGSDFAASSHCGSGVKAGSSCTIGVVFTAGTDGLSTGTLNITYANGVSTTQSVQLNGSGLVTKASFSPPTLAFGYQIIGTTSAPMISNLENTGVQPLTITGFTVSGPYGYTTNCGSTLAAHASCQVFVTFTPTEIGSYGTLTASTDAGQIGLSMTGTGTELLVSPSSINFGDEAVGSTSAPSIITLTNEGHSQILRLSKIFFSGANSRDFAETTTCGSTLSPGASCTISVTFTPLARGARSTTLNTNGGYGVQTVALSGTGT